MPKAATRYSKKMNSNEQDADFIPKESIPHKQRDRVIVKKTVRKEYAKTNTMRAPETAQEGMKLTLENPSSKQAKKPGQKRDRKTVVHVVGRPTSMYEVPAEVAEEEELANPPPYKKKKLMGDAMPTKSSPKTKPTTSKSKEPVAPKPKKTTRNIHASEKNKGSPSRHTTSE
ncbi:hypothetical protein ZWY2020_010826 [Hordeum vulgare]|nr:hypothetical protein ZWY2020_010826 [Hordeum vulgare]